MGNRACIIHENAELGIYLHWNGGPESVYPMLEYARAHARLGESDYAMSRLVQVIANFLGGNLDIGLFRHKDYDRPDPGNHGLYYIDSQLRVVRRVRRGNPLDVEEEERRAWKHAYNTESPTMLERLAEKNDAHFVS
ncbi:hypothetical protein [Oceanidesulfovibrio marinus]|uniref:Uncharacterized protein n=1 Tax=Oceanidesulfovibrio marinus TaxID=370038 RepID=A0A6P1ZDU0_9BACT|nr:hypothetical protein [Oceanidesulfovibrio marinus]TVM31187.1 hypothetical protein DQK91_18935 [Oceanidesulfovibrio marinus]